MSLTKIDIIDSIKRNLVSTRKIASYRRKPL